MLLFFRHLLCQLSQTQDTAAGDIWMSNECSKESIEEVSVSVHLLILTC